MVGYQLGPDYLGATATCPGCGEEHIVFGESIDHVVCPNGEKDEDGDQPIYIVGVDGKKCHYDKKSITVEVAEAYRDEDENFIGWVDDDPDYEEEA